MKVIKDSKNDLLNRREVALLVESTGNPGLTNSKKMISDHFKAKDELVAVKEVKGKFGRGTFLVKASIYEDKKNMDLIKPKVKVKEAKK